MNKKELNEFIEKFLKTCGVRDPHNMDTEDQQMVHGMLQHSHGSELIENELGRPLTVEEDLVLETMEIIFLRTKLNY